MSLPDKGQYFPKLPATQLASFIPNNWLKFSPSLAPVTPIEWSMLQFRFKLPSARNPLKLAPSSKKINRQQVTKNKQPITDNEGRHLQSQVRLTDHLVLEQLIPSAFGDNLSRGKHVVACGHLEDRADLLFPQEHGNIEL
jgi:hypothetical protein